MSWKDDPPSDIIPVFAPQQHIRRCIHQTYYSDSPDALPPEIARNITQLRQENPAWDYQLYGDDAMVEFIRCHYGARMVDFFQRINPLYGAARADLFRYLLMYQRGGVYLDIKSTLTRPLDEVLRADDRYLLSQWNNGPGEEYERWGIYPEIADAHGEFQQWHIVAAAGHPFLRSVIERVLRNIVRYNPVLLGQGSIGVLRVTGPIAYTLAILPQLSLHPHRRVDAVGELGFRYSIYPRVGSGAHQSLFRPHYAELQAPVVQLGMLDKLLSWVLRTLKGIALGSAQRRLHRGSSSGGKI